MDSSNFHAFFARFNALKYLSGNIKDLISYNVKLPVGHKVPNSANTKINTILNNATYCDMASILTSVRVNKWDSI